MGMNQTPRLVLILLIIIVVYGLFRYSETPNLKHLQQSDNFFNDVSPSECDIGWGDSQNGAEGVMYIYNGYGRMEYTVRKGNQTNVFYVIVDPDGLLYQWKDGVYSGYRKMPATSFLDFISVVGRMTCNPWWFPRAGVFKLPDNAKSPDL